MVGPTLKGMVPDPYTTPIRPLYSAALPSSADSPREHRCHGLQAAGKGIQASTGAVEEAILIPSVLSVGKAQPYLGGECTIPGPPPLSVPVPTYLLFERGYNKFIGTQYRIAQLYIPSHQLSNALRQ